MTRLMNVAISDIDPNPDNLRKELTGITELADSIAELGLIQPPTLQKVNGRFVVVAGHRRMAAIHTLVATDRLKADDTISALVQAQADEAQVTAQMLVENMQRVDLDPVEQMRGIIALIGEHGWKVKEVSERLGLSVDLVRSRASWVNLPDNVLTKISDRTLTIADADKLASLPVQRMKDLTAKKVPSNYDIDDEFRRAKRAAEAESLRKKLVKAGHTVTLNDKGHNVGAEEALDAVNALKATAEERGFEFEIQRFFGTPSADNVLAISDTPTVFFLEVTQYGMEVKYAELIDPNAVDEDDEEDEELTPYDIERERIAKLHRQNFEAWQADVKTKRLSYLNDSKASKLLADAIFEFLATTPVRPDMLELLELPEGFTTEDDQSKALAEWATKNATNLARAFTATRIIHYGGFDAPGVEKRPDYPEMVGTFDEDGQLVDPADIDDEE